MIIMRPQKRGISSYRETRVYAVASKHVKNLLRGSEREIKHESERERERKKEWKMRGFFTYNCEGDLSFLQSFILPQTVQFSEEEKEKKIRNYFFFRGVVIQIYRFNFLTLSLLKIRVESMSLWTN